MRGDPAVRFRGFISTFRCLQSFLNNNEKIKLDIRIITEYPYVGRFPPGVSIKRYPCRLPQVNITLCIKDVSP